MRKGQSIVELALALPVVLMMLFALFYASVVFVRKQAGDVLASSLCEYNATYFPPVPHWSSVVFVNLPPLPPLRIGATGRAIVTYATTDLQNEGVRWVDEYRAIEPGRFEINRRTGPGPVWSIEQVFITCRVEQELIQVNLPFLGRPTIRLESEYRTRSKWGMSP